jgi:protein TonB
MPPLRHSESALAGKSCGWSLLVHAGAIAGVLAWQALRLNDYERAEYSGKQGMVVLEASFQPPTDDSPATVVVKIAEPVETADTTAQVTLEAPPLEQKRLSEIEPAAQAMPVADVPSDLPPTDAAELERVAAASSQPSEAVSQPVKVAAAARPVTPPQPIASLAAIPETPGVRSETAVSWALNPQPIYPPLALARGWHGTALLRVWIDAAGAIERVEIERSSGFDILDGAAVAAVERWKARPATRFGQPIASVELQAIIFLPRRS